MKAEKNITDMRILKIVGNVRRPASQAGTVIVCDVLAHNADGIRTSAHRQHSAAMICCVHSKRFVEFLFNGFKVESLDLVRNTI
jgi:hypothetical protein